MTRIVLAFLVVALVAPLSVSARSHRQGPASFAFGRKGGTIEPYRVAISRTGKVTASGGVRQPGLADSVTKPAMDGLYLLARAEGFFRMQRATSCRGSLPDFSSSYVTVTTNSASRTVAVRGSCRPAFNQLYAVLAAVTRAR